MSAHDCKEITPGCYRCDLNLDEMAAIDAENAADAQAAWLKYRDDYMRRRALTARQAASQMRRREFVAGYMAGVDA